MKESISKKLNIFKTSPFIVVVAIIEVILLICVSTFAWFVFADNNKLYSDIISVEPDSGLEIDFSNANENDYINIWNYLNEFRFEPVTSLDGRNLFVPTSGTFNGKDNIADTPVSPDGPGDTQNSFFIYFDKTGSKWTDVWIETDYTAQAGSNKRIQMTQLKPNSNIYYLDLQKSLSDFNPTNFYTWVKFHDSVNSNSTLTSTVQLPNATIAENSKYSFKLNDNGEAYSGSYNGGNGMMLNDPVPYDGEAPDVGGDDSGNSGSGDGEGASSDSGSIKFREATVNDMNSKYINIDFTLTNTGAEAMPVYLSSKSYFKLYDPDTKDSIVSKALRIAFYQNDGENGKVTSSLISTGDENTTVFFNNTLGWDKPRAYVWDSDATDQKWPTDGAWPGLQMTHISGDLYYYTFNKKYDNIQFNNGNDSNKSEDIKNPKNSYIYSLGSKNNENEYTYTCVEYVSEDYNDGYPVISPGVSTGFQRPYAPVTEIDNFSGKPTVVVPAFASSIDDYNYGSEKPLFTVGPSQTLSLSMVIWLEGTDPDCTEDVYAGKSIDMNLVFATSQSDEQTYTYKFLDKTRENWIDDKIEIATGVSFNPVMQLYDAKSGKGYIMNVSKDKEGNPTIWTCNAPADLKDSKHIMFRRVNPMKEDEVWNYWDTDGFKDTGADVEVTDSDGTKSTTVYFSAFSDGAPTNAKNENGTKYTGAPAKSCGGLWGDHEVHTVTVFDGTKDQWIKNSDKSGTTSVLTMNYQYNYPGGKTQTVEYKASGATDKGMYYFVVPYNVYSKNGSSHQSAITFKRYFNFNDKHALNSDKNELTYHMSWTKGTCKGKFFEINGNTQDACYWGSDMLYIQAKSPVKSKMDGSWLQVHFYANSDGTNSSNDFYTYLYKHDYYKPDDGGYGYACVVPSNRDYWKYRVERCNSSDHSQVHNATPKQTVNNTASAGGTDNNEYSNTVGKNICSIENLFLNIYLEVPNNMSNKDWCPEYYIWKDSTGGNEKAWPGNSMTFVQAESASGNSTVNLFKCYVDISRYDRILFSNEYDGQNRNYGGNNTIGTDSDYNGMVFRAGGSYPNNLTITKQTDGRIGPNEVKEETMNVALYEAEHWDKNGS